MTYIVYYAPNMFGKQQHRTLAETAAAYERAVNDRLAEFDLTVELQPEGYVNATKAPEMRQANPNVQEIYGVLGDQVFLDDDF